MDNCTHLKEFMAMQLEVMKRHIDEHKWCKQIADANEGMIDFIKVYGWVLRESYCLYCCEDSDVCKIARDLEKKYETDAGGS